MLLLLLLRLRLFFLFLLVSFLFLFFFTFLFSFSFFFSLSSFSFLSFFSFFFSFAFFFSNSISSHRLREVVENHAGKPLAHPNHLVKTYMGPLTAKKATELRAEVAGQYAGTYHGGTTREGEVFAIVLRWMG